MSVMKPNAPPTPRFSMSGMIEARPAATVKSVVSSPGKFAFSDAVEPGVPEKEARVKKKGSARSGWAAS